MTWTVISLLACALLAIRLMFFMDRQRSRSRLIYRVPMFVVVLWMGYQLIEYAYHPVPIPSWRALSNVCLLIGSFFLQPHHLPWNQTR